MRSDSLCWLRQTGPRAPHEDPVHPLIPTEYVWSSAMLVATSVSISTKCLCTQPLRFYVARDEHGPSQMQEVTRSLTESIITFS